MLIMSKEIQKHSDPNIQNRTSVKKLDLTAINHGALSASLGELSIPRLYYQLIVFVLDASQSMTWEGLSGKSKGEEIHDQIIPIIERLKTSKNKKSFDISMYAFSENYTNFLSITNPEMIDLTKVNFNPCSYVNNYRTYAEPVLLEVENEINSYLSKHKGKSSQAMIIFLGDGAIHDYSKVIEICNRLNTDKRITILSYLLEDKAWKAQLTQEELEGLKENIKRMSSKDSNGLSFFESKVDPEEIRNHMIKSISTVSKID
jgi:hypothetical protein